jgi:uncharacterized protein (TIGR02145 family)
MLHVPCSVHAQIPSYVPTNGLVGWWPFNGNANDESGNGNNGTVNGATLTTDRFGAANNAYSFDGVNDYIDYASGSSTSLNVIGDFTVSFWAKTSNTGSTARTIISFGDQINSNSGGIIIGINDGFPLGPYGRMCYATQGIWSQSTLAINDNVWHFIVISLQGSVMKLYIDNTLNNQTLNQLPTLSWNGGRRIGAGNYGMLAFYKDLLDDIAIYNRALTQQEITNLYTSSVPPSITTTASLTLINCGESATLIASSTSAAQPCIKADLPATLQTGLVGYWPFCGNANDASGNNNNGTVNGATLTTDRFGNANSAYSFDGLSNYISVNNTSNLNPTSISISGWVNNSASPTNNQEGSKALITKWFQQINCGNNGDNYTLQISRNNNTNVFIAASVYNNLFSSAIGSSNDIIGLFNWHHFTFIHDALIGEKLFVDGVLVSSNSVTGNLCSTTNKLYFGCDNDLGTLWRFFSGKLDDIAIYNRALTATEIQQLYSLGNVNYSWSTGATTPSISVTPAQTTAYPCTATNSAGSTTSSVTVTVADSLSWTGLFDTDWHKPCNWSPQFVPKCCNNVLIPVTSNQPIVSGVAAAEDLTIFTTNGAQLTVNSGANLQIADCPTTITTATCPSLAVLTTTAVSSITQTTAISGGTINYQGASAIAARGICWSTSINPTIASSFTTNGTGIGTFTSNLTGLTAGTTYYVRAYATNASGTSYGNEVSFVAVNPQPAYPANSVFCASGPTLVIDVTNAATGKTWMDRNLGATQVATSSTDAAAYGDLYQWGRGNDGHQCRNSATTTNLSSMDQPGNGLFIISPNTPNDWRSPQNGNLWQGVNGVNNPCPSGYRVPTEVELQAERPSWISQNSVGAFNSILKLPMAGYRGGNDGVVSSSTLYVGFWSSTVNGNGTRSLYVTNLTVDGSTNSRADGTSVRCIKN